MVPVLLSQNFNLQMTWMTTVMTVDSNDYVVMIFLWPWWPLVNDLWQPKWQPWNNPDNPKDNWWLPCDCPVDDLVTTLNKILPYIWWHYTIPIGDSHCWHWNLPVILLSVELNPLDLYNTMPYCCKKWWDNQMKCYQFWWCMNISLEFCKETSNKKIQTIDTTVLLSIYYPPSCSCQFCLGIVWFVCSSPLTSHHFVTLTITSYCLVTCIIIVTELSDRVHGFILVNSMATWYCTT